MKAGETVAEKRFTRRYRDVCDRRNSGGGVQRVGEDFYFDQLWLWERRRNNASVFLDVDVCFEYRDLSFFDNLLGAVRTWAAFAVEGAVVSDMGGGVYGLSDSVSRR